MTYGHAERNLACIRQLEIETRQLLLSVAPCYHGTGEAYGWGEQQAARTLDVARVHASWPLPGNRPR